MRLFAIGLTLLLAASAAAVDYRIEVLKEKPPADAVSKPQTAELADTGYRVFRGTRTMCDIWLCKQWTVGPASKKADIRYPFTQGQFLGVIRYARSSNDFKDQKVSKGVYTMRYALQPLDGNHVGTFSTRDFVLLLSAEADQKLAPPEPNTLVELSAEAAQSAHPAMLCLLKSNAKKTPAIRHNEGAEWWIIQISGMALEKDKDGKPKPLNLDMVVVGQAGE